MKLIFLLTCFLISASIATAVAANGCQIGTGTGSRVYVDPPPTCSGCPSNRELWSGGKNYIVFSNGATECNSSPYNNVNVQYIRIGDITNRLTAFGHSGSNSCYITNGGSGTYGVAVSYLTYYNCPLDQSVEIIAAAFSLFSFYFIKRFQFTKLSYKD